MVADRQSHSAHRSTNFTEADATISRYRRHRQRQLQKQRARANRPIPTTEADIVIRTALTWVPYGGVPEDDIFQMFGMTRSRFLDTLWRTVRYVKPDKGTIDQLARVYLDPRLRGQQQMFSSPPTNE